MSDSRAEQWLRFACYLTLVALGLITWSLFDPRPIPVILAMSAGQVVGTAAFAIYLRIVYTEARRKGVLRDSETNR